MKGTWDKDKNKNEHDHVCKSCSWKRVDISRKQNSPTAIL